MLRSRIVRWLRVILPLAALAILSVLFLIARAPETGPIPYAEGRLEDLARAPGMTAPQFSTVTPGGATVTLTAAAAVPEASGETGTARDIALDWRERGGLTLTLSAAEAAVKGGHLSFSGDVDLRLSSGWRLAAARIEADTETEVLTAPDAVAVTAPFGELTAGAMRLSRAADGRQVLELNRGVRLIYRP